MAEMICDIQQGASIDVWAGSPDSVEAAPLMPQSTLSQRDAGGHRRSRRWFRAHGLASPPRAKPPCAASIPPCTIAHFHLLDTLLVEPD